MGFLWLTGFSFFHCVASPFHSFVTLKGTCWCKPRSQPSCATTRAISPKGNGRATKPATSAAGPPIPAIRVTATLRCDCLNVCRAASSVWVYRSVTLRRKNKASNIQEPTKRAFQSTVEAEHNCEKRCGARYAKPINTASRQTHTQLYVCVIWFGSAGTVSCSWSLLLFAAVNIRRQKKYVIASGDDVTAFHGPGTAKESENTTNVRTLTQEQFYPTEMPVSRQHLPIRLCVDHTT